MPLTFDLSYDELLTYQGINPRPDDFDAYWEDALAEMRMIDSQIERVPADFQVDFARCEHLYFTGVGGARVHAKLLTPRATLQPGPALLMFHGYASNSGDWVDKLPYVAQGFTVAALDCRGQGGPSEDVGGVRGTTLRGHIVRGLDDAPEKLLYRAHFLDTAQLADIIMSMPQVDAARVGATGRSQGGGLTLACAALEPRISRIAPIYPFLSDYRRVWEMDLDVDAYAELREWFRRFDPMHRREDEVFTRLGYIDVQHLAPRIRARTRFYVGLMDTTCPPSTQFAAYNKITAPKELVVYPDYAHEYFPGRNDQIFEFMAGL